MANPIAWIPFHGDKRARRAALLGIALVASLVLHVALPFVRFSSVSAVSEVPITVDLIAPPMPLPEAEKLVESLDEIDSPAPPVPEKPPVVAKKAAEEPQPQKDVEQAAPEPEPEAAPLPVETAKKVPDAVARLQELEKRRLERIAERERRRAEREARRRAALEAEGGGAGGKAGGAPASGEWRTGKPQAVYACTASERGVELHVTKERPLTDWIPIVPTVLAGFETRPGLGGYLDQVTQIVSRERQAGVPRRGFVEIAAPNTVMQLELDEPRGTRLAIGRLDGRCLVGFKYTSRLFPMVLVKAPVRFIDRQNNTVNALVDITFYKDMSLDLASADGTELPFAKARVKNSKDIQRNITDHYEAARLAKQVADLFGIDLRPKRPPPKATPAQQQSLAQSKGTKGQR